MAIADRLTDEERRTLSAEQDLLERVADLATLPGRLDRALLDATLRSGSHSVSRVPRPRRRRDA